MAWKDRLREAAYTSPSGTRITFYYEDVQRVFEKKTTAFEFPDANGTFIQDLGNTGRRYPFRMFFTGENYDLEANAFEEILLERGIGKLEHPIYGVINVVPFGEVTRRDNFKTAANQAIIDVIFWESIDLIYPSAQSDPGSSIISAVDEYNNAKASQFEQNISLDTVSKRVSFKNSYDVLLDNAANILRPIAETQENVKNQFDLIYDSINRGIDVLIADPITLAFQTNLLIQSPSRALTNIQARLNGYKNLTNSIILGNSSQDSNEFYTNDLYASTYVTGSILSVINNQFTTKKEAVGAADSIVEQFSDVTNWRDDNFELLSQGDTGEAYEELQNAVALTAGFLVDISFSLKQERSIILDRNRSIIDLSAELYGSVDDYLDLLISSNNLTGSEILELPKGREIVYYV